MNRKLFILFSFITLLIGNSIHSSQRVFGLSCSDLSKVDTATQVSIVQSDTSCSRQFVTLLESNPLKYLPAFYQLVSKNPASDVLFNHVYDDIYSGRFIFTDGAVIDDMVAKFPNAVAACTGGYRCSDWKIYILSPLLNGGLYKCPTNLSSLSSSVLMKQVPYADYYCTESLVAPLAIVADSTTVQGLLSIAGNNTNGWSRRNAIRILGRFVEASTKTQTLVTVTHATDVKAALRTRLTADKDGNVLEDAMWVLDSYFFPYLASLAPMQTISKNTAFTSSVRFRAITASGRLIHSKTGIISSTDLTYLTSSLSSNDLWVRAEAAFIFELIPDDHINDTIRTQIVSSLTTASTKELEMTPKVYIARALDRFQGGTTNFDRLQKDYETKHLPNTLSQGNITIRSSLPTTQLSNLMTLVQNEQNAFFQIMGTNFKTPLPTDNNTNITLVIFGTPAEYTEYMNSFIGYAAYSGGLYLQEEGKLYTYERTPEQSTYTLKELLQHEFSHYLQHRYIYPGSFSSPGYFDEPKGWIDEGTAEVYAGMVFSTTGSYSLPLRKNHLTNICNQPFASLQTLLSQTEGYSDPGVFDYKNGWAFMHYLLTSRKPIAMNIYTAMKNNTYHLSDFATIAGVSSVAALESDWHVALQTWCKGTPTPSITVKPTIKPSLTPTPTVKPSITPTPTKRPSLTPTPTVKPSITPTPTKRPSLTPTPTAKPSVLQQPYNGTPLALPAKIQIENYDKGGEGVAYHDIDSTNQGGKYRETDGVDIAGIVDWTGGYAVGFTKPGEWMEYSTVLGNDGTYTFDIRVASYLAGGKFHVEFNGVNKTGTLTIPSTGGWQKWTTLTLPISLNKGNQIIRIVMDTTGTSGYVGNFDYMEIQ